MSLQATIIESLANHIKPFLIVPMNTTVQIIRARVPRQILALLRKQDWSQLVRKLPQDVSVHIERSIPLNTHRDDGLLELLSAMEAMLRRYDGFKSLFALRRPLEVKTPEHRQKSASPQAKPGSAHEPNSSPSRGRGRFRKGEEQFQNQVSSTSQKLLSDSSKSTHSSTASSQERAARFKSRPSLPHATAASRVSAPHTQQIGTANRGLSHVNQNPPPTSKPAAHRPGLASEQGSRLSSASPSPAPQRGPAPPISTSQSSLRNPQGH